MHCDSIISPLSIYTTKAHAYVHQKIHAGISTAATSCKSHKLKSSQIPINNKIDILWYTGTLNPYIPITMNNLHIKYYKSHSYNGEEKQKDTKGIYTVLFHLYQTSK